jgi:hypothetical protein
VRTITPAGRGFFKTWTSMLAKFDLKQLYMGGMGVSAYLGHLEETRDFAKAFRHLPAVEFSPLKSANALSTTVGRSYVGSKRSYCYLVNPEGSPIKVELSFTGVDRIYDPVRDKTLTLHNGTWNLVLPAYGIQSFSCSNAGRCTQFYAEPPNQELKNAAKDYRDLLKSAENQYPDLKQQTSHNVYL